MQKHTNLHRPICLFAAALFVGGAVVADEDKLVDIHADIEADYAAVTHIGADAFEALNIENRIVFDVREADEFAVSHLDGAIQVDPDISADEFAERFGAMIAGRSVVFYCSVGRRSSMLAQRLDGTMTQEGAAASFNLIGGIFNWRNEQRPLMDANGETQAVHPYNSYWGRLIDDSSAIRFE